MRTGREAGAGAFAFLEVSDGSCFGNIQARGLGCLPPCTCLARLAESQHPGPGPQVMVTKEVAEAVGGLKAITSTGTSVMVEGELTETPPGTKQARRPLPCAPVMRLYTSIQRRNKPCVLQRMPCCRTRDSVGLPASAWSSLPTVPVGISACCLCTAALQGDKPVCIVSAAQH